MSRADSRTLVTGAPIAGLSKVSHPDSVRTESVAKRDLKGYFIYNIFDIIIHTFVNNFGKCGIEI